MLLLKNLVWEKAMRKFVKGRESNDGLFGFEVKPSMTKANKRKDFTWFRYDTSVRLDILLKSNAIIS